MKRLIIKELEENPFVPTIIAGAGQKWYTNSDKNALFSSNAEFKDFLKVLVDGKELDGSDYIVYSGSTVVELKVSYLKTLSVGEHTLSIVSKSGTATTTFIIVKDPNTTEPDTTKPSETNSDITKPSGTNPDTTKPSGTNPDTTKPSGTNPDTTKPSGTNPDTTKPNGTNPDTTKPSGTNPDTTRPGSTNPSTGAVGGNTDNNGRNEDSPNTGVGNDLLMWIALLFISGGVLVGVNVIGKNKKRS